MFIWGRIHLQDGLEPYDWWGFFFSVIRPQIRFCCSGQENEQQILIFSLYCLPLHPDEMVDSVEPSASAASVQPKGEATKETHSLFQSSYVGKIAVQHPSVSPPGSHALVNLLYPDILVSKCQPVFGDGVWWITCKLNCRTFNKSTVPHLLF